MIELVTMAQEVAKSKLEGLADKMRLPELSEGKNLTVPSDQELARRAETSAHFACKFFDLPDTVVREGKCISVNERDLKDKTDDVLEYNVNQFRQMDCTGIADMTKIWFHECGHRILQGIVKEPWVDELGADFFAGVSSEMSGLPKGGLEKILSVQQPSESHPGGATRLMAMEYGRFIASQMKGQGIKPTWKNCVEAFQSSPFWNISYKDFANSNGNPLQGTENKRAFVDTSVYGIPPVTVGSPYVSSGTSTVLGNLTANFNPYSSYNKVMTPVPGMTTWNPWGHKPTATELNNGFLEQLHRPWEAKTTSEKMARDMNLAFAKYNVGMDQIKFDSITQSFNRAKDVNQYRGRVYGESHTTKLETDSNSRAQMSAEKGYSLKVEKPSFFADRVKAMYEQFVSFIDFRLGDWSPFRMIEKGTTKQFIDNKAYHLGNAADAQAKVNSNLKRSQEAVERGDYKQARDYARSAERWQTSVKDEKRAAERSKKFIDDKQNDVSEVEKTGGSYGDLKREGWGWNDIPPHEIHHIPSNESSPLETVDGPAIVMEYTDHRKTASCGNSRDAKEYRAYQKQLIDNGKFAEALQMDVDDLHEKFGTKYDVSITEAQAYMNSLKETGKI